MAGLTTSVGAKYDRGGGGGSVLQSLETIKWHGRGRRGKGFFGTVLRKGGCFVIVSFRAELNHGEAPTRASAPLPGAAPPTQTTQPRPASW